MTPPQEHQKLYSSPDTPPPDVPTPLKVLASDPTSLAHLLSTGKTLHPFLLDNYHVIEELGAGGYGVVVRALRVPDMQDVAVKILWRTKMPKEGWVAVTGWEPKLLTTPVVVPREAHILRQISHPGVIAYVDYFEDDNFLYLVMEHFGTPWNVEMARDSLPVSVTSSVPQANAVNPVNSLHLDLSPKTSRPAGPIRRASRDLFECLEAYQRLPEETSKFIFKQLADTVCYLHRSGIVHCDLKDENIVIDADFRVKIIDFGSAQMLDPLKPAPYHQKFRGTITFAAPEILRGEVFQAPQAEVWALGCILSILLTGKGPFASADAARKAQISEPAAPIPLLAFDLMMGCLRLKPQDRLNICQIKDHPWLMD
ncbi:kinase-like protein [Cystobasidium minutum MCA 4210]|uniref:kinase-like protein n=1 Tax=Cystobasidium minutum MCA 4210 TaxID=1397322 RepID=UPI0034CD4576|eukprot:jgi/Rhomi1/141163/e_gw1.2.238.1